MGSVERRAIEAFLDEAAEEISHQRFGNGVLTVWRNIHSLPTRRACTFTSGDGNVSVPNTGDDKCFALLSQAIASDADLEQISMAIPLVSPVPRRLVLELQPYLQYLSNVWHQPTLERRRFECYAENLTSGRVERLIVDANSHQIVDVGEGLRFALR